ncbi:hypothetical protein Csa_000646 [Cucumis sativus]|uniref:Uncharacterized protein n=1 Tax=Cucumis sativus TaxID=3659 RepID=A0A0A0KND9_CUCSA|nr:hypothetical protein Csa_000646 [Cucumis sativus]
MWMFDGPPLCRWLLSGNSSWVLHDTTRTLSLSSFVPPLLSTYENLLLSKSVEKVDRARRFFLM